jgi:hypothetical protein
MSDFHTDQVPIDRRRRREMDACQAREFLARSLAWEIALGALRTDGTGPEPAKGEGRDRADVSAA